MNMMMMNIKGRKALWGLLLLPILLVILVSWLGDVGSSGTRQLELQTFQSGDGWGYKIVTNSKVLIFQPSIPAIDTVMPFHEERTARAVGMLVLQRMKRNERFSVDKEEVCDLISR